MRHRVRYGAREAVPCFLEILEANLLYTILTPTGH